jgi:hypothetical protein
MLKLQNKPLKEGYHATIRDEGTTIGEIFSCAQGFNAFSSVPGESFDLLVATASTIEDTLAAFLQWRNNINKKQGP